MDRSRITTVSLLTLLVLAPGLGSARPAASAHSTESAHRIPAARILHSNTSSSAGMAKAPTDTFTLFGGPGTLEGKFQNVNELVPDRQGWIGVDNTDKPVYWQVSTFNAETLGGHGVGNHAAWSGQDSLQQLSWANPPGYGNNWNDILLFRSGALADPATGQTVSLDFVFHYDTEPGYDFFSVEYDSAGSWKTVYSVSGSNAVAGVFSAPGVQFSSVATGSITYAGGDYGGPDGDEIQIRLRFTSDGAWSEEDGLRRPTQGAGAVQVDDISLTWSDGTSFEDFEGGPAFGGSWLPFKVQYVGDFSKVMAKMSDLDPCVENDTPLMMFVDDGSVVGNSSCNCGGCIFNICSTAGQTSPNWNYGVTNGWVVNYTGGLTNGTDSLDNEVWSPEIVWDLPGAADDGADVIGAKLRYSMWDHLVIANWIIPTWAVRSSSDGVKWSPWRNTNFLFYVNSGPAWRSIERDITAFLEPNPLKVQISLGVIDIADTFGFSSDDATPAPAYDNVSLIKYRVGGPDISVFRPDLAHDGFPPVGNIDVSTMAARDALDIPFDGARDVNSGSGIDTADSIVTTVKTVIANTTISDLRMIWILDKNPLFEDPIRSLPARSVDQNTVAGPTQWSGEVLASAVVNSQGVPVADRFFYDLPDADLLYPGDVLRYYFQATDSDGRVSTLPDNTTGFASGALYDRDFVVRGLPSISDAAGTQPTKLYLDFTGGRENAAANLHSLREVGLLEGVHYDTYTKSSPTSGHSNGIGSAGGHGATAAQLQGYDTIIVAAANNSFVVLSDGSNAGGNDKSDDLGVLSAWRALPGIRNVAYFGDGFVGSLANGGAASAAYAQDVLGVSYVDDDVRDEIGMQSAPTALALNVNFMTRYVAQGGCPNINRFDSIRARPGSSRGYAFTDLSGAPIPDIATAVIHDRIEGGDRKVDMTFAHGLSMVTSPVAKSSVNSTARTDLLRDVFGFFGVSSGLTDTATPEAKTVSMSVSPNPFNPRTVVRFTGLAANASGSVRVYNTRGELVVVLHDGPFTQPEFVWDGTDGNGRAVASGVYMIEGRADEFRRVEKVAVLK